MVSSQVSPHVLEILIDYKYLFLFPILFAEGPVATIIVSTLATPEANIFNVIPLYFFVVFADLFGDVFYYLLGRYAGEKVLNKLSARKRVNFKELIQNYFDKYGNQTLVIGKVSHFLGWPVMVFAGSAQMNFFRFMTINFFTSLAKNVILVGVGYFYSENYQEIVDYFGSVSITISLTFLVALLFYFFYTKSSRIK